jgi:SAM-dependent methyltransferase
MTAGIDKGAQLAVVQGELWGEAARDWVELQEPMFKPLWAAVLLEMGVGPGITVFDAGCGGGGASLLAAELGTRIYGLDASVELLKIAKERVPGGDFCIGDLQVLPYRNGVFDLLLASNSLDYVYDPIKALFELRRTCRSTGIVVVATWGLPEYCDQREVFKAASSVLPIPAASEDAPFAFSGKGVLGSLVEQVGLKVCGYREVDCVFEYPDLETFWRAQASAGPMQAILRTVPEEELKKAVLKAVHPYVTDDGAVKMKNRLSFVMAMRWAS